MSKPRALSNDMEYGRRAIVMKQKMLHRHLEDIVRLSLNRVKSYTPEIVTQFIIEVAAGRESYRSSAAKHGISYNTVNQWKKHGWIYEAVEIAKELVQEKIDRRLTGVIDKALTNLDDQLSKGEEIVTKTGTIMKKAVCAKDNALIAAIAFDKRQLLRGEATQIHEEKAGEDKLLKLAEEFKKFAMKEEKVIVGEVVEEHDTAEIKQGVEEQAKVTGSNRPIS